MLLPPTSTLFPYTTLFRSWRLLFLGRRTRPRLRRRGQERPRAPRRRSRRSEEHTSELQSLTNLVCRLLLEKKKKSRALRRRQSRDLNRAKSSLRTGFTTQR